jgi:hypothetical protein
MAEEGNQNNNSGGAGSDAGSLGRGEFECRFGRWFVGFVGFGFVGFGFVGFGFGR